MRRGGYESAWRPSATPAPEVAEVRRRAFRRAMWLQISAVALGTIYLLVARDAIHRAGLLAVLIATAIVTALMPVWGEELPRRRAGAIAMLAHYGVLSLLASMAVWATGEGESPLWAMYIGIAVLVAWSFDGRTVISFAAATWAIHIAALWVTNSLPSREAVLMRSMVFGLTIAGLSLLAVELRRQSERALVSAREAGALAAARGAVADQAKRLHEAQAEFVSTVSHELRTPLTAIIGTLKTLQRGAAPDPETASALTEAASRHALRLNALIEDLLTASRVGSGALTVRVEEIDGGEIAGEVVSQLRTARPGCDIELIADGRVSLCSDRDHLHRVLLNLADNAIRYGAGAPVRMHVTGLACGRVRFVVEDEGPGIDPLDHLRIFERFAQLDKRVDGGGTGLGLHICSALVHSLGGHLVVSSLPGQGAAFGFTLNGTSERSVPAGTPSLSPATTR